MSRALLRSVPELRAAAPRLALRTLTTSTTTPHAAAPSSPRLFNQTPPNIDPPPPTDAAAITPVFNHRGTVPSRLHPSRYQPKHQPHNPPPELLPKSAPPPPAPAPLDPSVSTLLPLLAAQPAHYVTVHIHGRPYLVTAGDTVKLPFRMPGVAPGDVLRLNRASVLGSRDYTLKGAPWVDERLFAVRAVVTGTETEPPRLLIKKRRRCRRKRRVVSQHWYTTLTISEVKVCRNADSEVGPVGEEGEEWQPEEEEEAGSGVEK
ncbi:ribosomal protein L21-like protein [Podospora conica]|nr:ribosomal protein L21-like protein [Schizothecium conicum]